MDQRGKDIIATVNNVEISKKKLHDLMGTLAFQNYKTVLADLGPDKLKAINETALERVIINELLHQEGKKMGITVYKDEIERELQESKGDFPFPELYRDFLESEGLTEEGYKRVLEEEILIKKTKEKLLGDFKVPEEELREYYEEHKDEMVIPERVRASHILIKIEPDDPPDKKEEARKKIEELREMVMEGHDLGKLAYAFSHCPSADDYGDLGYLVRGQTEKNFDRALFSLKEGAISDIVETRYGYHIIYLKERLKEEHLSYEDAKGEIEKKIKEAKEEVIIAEIMERLRESADIKVYGEAKVYRN